MRMYRSKSQLLLIFLAVGFLIGIIYQNVISNRQIIGEELFLKSNLERYLHMNIVTERYLWYVVKERGLLFVGMFLLGTIKWKKLLAGVSLCVMGFVMGVLTVSAVLQMGAKGILLCIVGLFPQVIFYGIVFAIVLTYWYWYPTKQWNYVKTIFVIGMSILGIIVEVYVNPILVKWMIGIF